MLSVSVIICTRKPREVYLRRVLEALRNQTLPKERWELLVLSVAADGPLSGTFELSWHPHARFVLVERIGKTNAFLQAISESEGGLLAIVDDDNVLRADYLKASLKISEQYPSLGAWGGSCLPEFEVPPSPELEPWLSGLVTEKLTNSYWAKIRSAGEAMPPGAGMVVRRPVAERYRQLVLKDPLRQGLGPNGEPGNAGEDDDLALCGFDMGLGTGRFPELELTHLIPARKLTLTYFEKLYDAFAYAGVILGAIHGKAEPFPGRLKIGAFRLFLMTCYLLISRKSRVERRIRLAMERGKMRAEKDLIRIGRH